MIKWCFFCFIMLILSPLQSEELDPNYSITAKKLRGPALLGIEFGEKESELVQTLEKMGLIQISRVESVNRSTKTLSYQGVPKGFGVDSGKTQLIFFQNSLVEVGIEFNPSYEHFLILRKQLLGSLGDRFTIERKEEIMDDSLRTYLANLQSKTIEKVAEENVTSALERGHTLWYYQLKDNQGKLKVILSYSASNNAQGSKKPALRLFYSWTEGTDLLKEYEKSHQVIKILP